MKSKHGFEADFRIDDEGYLEIRQISPDGIEQRVFLSPEQAAIFSGWFVGHIKEISEAWRLEAVI